MNPIEAMLNFMAFTAFGMTKDEAHTLGICLNCKTEILDLDELSERGYEISGLCQKCQNEFFEEES